MEKSDMELCGTAGGDSCAYTAKKGFVWVHEAVNGNSTHPIYIVLRPSSYKAPSRASSYRIQH